MVTVRQWLLDNIPFYPDRDELIRECVKELRVERNQVTRIMKSLREASPPQPLINTDAGMVSESDLTPHLKYDSIYEHFMDWMGATPHTPMLEAAFGEKVVHGVLACSHAPFQDDEALREAHQFFQGEGVEVVHLAGDVADCYSLSTFTKFETVPIQREAVEVRKVVDFFSQHYKQVKVLEGNHESRERKYLYRSLPPDIAEWVLQASFLQRITEDMSNVELVKFSVDGVEQYEIGWLEVVGVDTIIGHAEKTTSMVDSLRGVEKLREWINNGWGEVLGISRPRVVFNAHSHRAGIIPIGDTILCELGCCCKIGGYALSPKKLYGKPQTQAATIFTQVEGVTDVNSIRQRYLGR